MFHVDYPSLGCAPSPDLLPLNRETILSFKQRVGEVLADDVIRLGYGFLAAKEVFALGSSVSHAVGFLVGKKPKDVDWYIKLEDWNEEISARVDAVVRQVFQNYRYYSLEIGKKGSFFRNYRIGPLDLSIACPPSDMPDSWATINAFQILFDPDGVSAYLRKSDFAPSSKSNEDIWEMNANNQSLLNYERMDAIPDLYLLFSFARYRGIEFTNVTPNIEDLCCGSFYQLYEKRPLTLHKKLKGFIERHFDISLELESAKQFLAELHTRFKKSSVSDDCKKILDPIFDGIELASLKEDQFFLADPKESKRDFSLPRVRLTYPKKLSVPLQWKEGPFHQKKTSDTAKKPDLARKLVRDQDSASLRGGKHRDEKEDEGLIAKKRSFGNLIVPLSDHPVESNPVESHPVESNPVPLVDDSSKNKQEESSANKRMWVSLEQLLDPDKTCSLEIFLESMRRLKRRKELLDTEKRSLLVQKLTKMMGKLSLIERYRVLISFLETIQKLGGLTWTQEETSLVVREIENCLGKRSISKANHLFRFLPGEKQKEFVEAFRLRNHENIHESLKWNVGNSMQALSFYERIKPVEKLKERTDLEDLTKEEKTFRETRRTFVTQPKQFNGLSRRTKYVRPIFLATGALIVAATVAAWVAKAIYLRPECTAWTLDVAKGIQNHQKAIEAIALREEEYTTRARLNCESEEMRVQKREEVLSFCKTNYSMMNIPPIWRLPSSSLLDEVCLSPPKPMRDMAQVYLTCYVHEVLKAHRYAKNVQNRLEYLKAQQPLFCF